MILAPPTFKNVHTSLISFICKFIYQSTSNDLLDRGCSSDVTAEQASKAIQNYSISTSDHLSSLNERNSGIGQDQSVCCGIAHNKPLEDESRDESGLR